MKTTIKLLFLLLLFLQGCDKKDDNIEFTSAALYQTRWKGTMEEGHLGDKIVYKSEIGINFFSKTEASSSVYRSSGDLTESKFEYEIKGKILNIRGAIDFRGVWYLISFKDKEMVLERGTGGEGAYKSTLRLRKI